MMSGNTLAPEVPSSQMIRLTFNPSAFGHIVQLPGTSLSIGTTHVLRYFLDDLALVVPSGSGAVRALVRMLLVALADERDTPQTFALRQLRQRFRVLGAGTCEAVLVHLLESYMMPWVDIPGNHEIHARRPSFHATIMSAILRASSTFGLGVQPRHLVIDDCNATVSLLEECHRGALVASCSGRFEGSRFSG